MFPSGKADAGLVRQLLQGLLGGLVERSQHDEVLTPVHDSYMSVTTKHQSPFFITIQKVEGGEGLDKRLCRGDRGDATALFDAVRAEGSLQHSSTH